MNVLTLPKHSKPFCKVAASTSKILKEVQVDEC